MFVQQSPFFLLLVNVPWQSGVFFRKFLSPRVLPYSLVVQYALLPPPLTPGVNDTKKQLQIISNPNFAKDWELLYDKSEFKLNQ